MIQATENLEFIFSQENLYLSWVNVASKKSAPGIDSITVDKFAANCNSNLTRLRNNILNNRYSPQPVIVFPKAKKDNKFREIVIPTVADKIVAKTIADFEIRKLNSTFAPQSYAYRPKKSALKAISVVEEQIKSKKFTHVVRIDIKEFFDSINHSILLNMLREYNHSQELIDLVMLFAKNSRFDGIQLIQPDSGVPQGSPLAPIISNIYLDYLDKQINTRSIPFLRYADDIIIFAEDINAAGEYMNFVISLLNSLDLEVSINKTRIYSVDKGFIYLGFFFSKGSKMPCKDAQESLSRKLASEKYDDESEEAYHKRLNTIRRGWNNYYYFDKKDDTNEINSDTVHKEEEHYADFEDTSDDLNVGSSAPGEGNVEGNYSEIQGVEISESFQENKNAINDENEKLQNLLNELEILSIEGDDNKIIRKLRAILSGECELDDSLYRKLNRQLADLYDKNGLKGAANRCRKIAGDDSVKNSYKSKEELIYGTETVNQWLDIFHSDSCVYRQYIDRVGRSGYKPASKPLNAKYLLDHWLGKHTISIPLFDKNNDVRFGLLDLDISRNMLDNCSQDEFEKLKQQLLDDAIGILDIAGKAGVRGIIEDSGYKGYHIWFFFFNRIPAKIVKDFLQALNRVAGNAPEGTHRELFPAAEALTPDKLNSRIKMPLGIHRLSGKYSNFINRDGSIVKNGLLMLTSYSFFNKISVLKQAIRKWNEYCVPSTEIENNSNNEMADIDKLFSSCSVIRALKKKAEESGYLTHYERVVLRGVLAPLGNEGRTAIHSILKKCDNYNKSLTDKMLSDTSYNPIGCRRIREILSYMTQTVDCNCKFRRIKNDYAHPLRHLNKKYTGDMKNFQKKQVKFESTEKDKRIIQEDARIELKNDDQDDSIYPEKQISQCSPYREVKTVAQIPADKLQNDDIFSFSLKIGAVHFNMNFSFKRRKIK